MKTIHHSTKNDTILLAEAKPRTIYRFAGIVNVQRGRWGQKGAHHGIQHPPRRHRYGRREREIFRRLLDLGLTRGCTFEVIQESKNGPVLIELRGTRIAIGHGLAQKLLVEEVGPTE